MSGFETAMAVASVASLVQGVASAQQQSSQYKRQAAATRSAQEQQIAEINRQKAEAERQRQQKLKQSQATQRARFGAMGTGAAGGSAQALLQGLEKQSLHEKSLLEANANSRIAEINSASGLQTANLLDQASAARTNGLFGALETGLGIAKKFSSPSPTTKVVEPDTGP